MAVNVSAMEFRDENFLDGVCSRSSSETGLDPQLARAGADRERADEARRSRRHPSCRRCGNAGCKLAIDDFGTGYSSLSYLRKFPIDALKIDQSFVRQISAAGDETTIVTAVISMARSLKLRVVAEGVETLEELAFLQAHQCDEAQGYYFSRPVSPVRFAELLKTGISQSEGYPIQRHFSGIGGIGKLNVRRGIAVASQKSLGCSGQSELA